MHPLFEKASGLTESIIGAAIQSRPGKSLLPLLSPVKKQLKH